MSLEKDIADMIDKWCPDQFSNEPQSSRLLRAFFEANACSDSQNELAAGLEPLRPLDSFKPLRVKQCHANTKSR
jgi:hypothetical protein